MSKNQRTLKTREKETWFNNFSFDKYIPPKYQTVSAILSIVVLLMIFFAPLYFEGKTVVSGDIMNGQSSNNFFQKDDVCLWNPYAFCGMPSFGKIGWYDISGTAILNISSEFSKLLVSAYNGWTIYFLFLGIFFYFLMRYLKATVIVAIVVAVAAMFSTGILVLFYIGHITKLLSLITFPLVILFLLKFNEKIRIIDVLLFTLVIHFLFLQWHVQIMFYIFFTVAIFYLYYFVRSIVVKDKFLKIQLVKSLVIFMVISGIGIGLNYYKLKQIYEYTQFSTRGTKSIADLEMNNQQQSEEEFYQYATNWSFSPGEIMTFFFPSYYGFGNSIYNGPLTNDQDYKVNTYFGQMPFVDVAQYMGVVVLALALFAMFMCRKDPLVQFLTILVLISLLLSFGRTFPILFNILFYHFPFFDKFRAPSMILNIVQLSLPILAGLGLMKILSIKLEKDLLKGKLIRMIALSVTGLFVISLLANQSISGWFTDRIADSGQRAQELNPLYDYMSNMFLNDVLFAFALISAVFWLSYLFVKGKISFDFLGVAVLLIIIIDLWRIDTRGSEYVVPKEITQQYTMPDYIKFIKNEKNTQPFRLLNLKQDGSLGSFNQDNNFYAYFLEEDFNGYSGIKPRSYQDIIDVVGPANPTLWRFLNVKYLITSDSVNLPWLKLLQREDKTFLYDNGNALPRAFFVDSVVTAKPSEILNEIKSNSFDPLKIAFAEGENINIDKVGANAYIKLKDYEPEKIIYDVNATGDNLLFLGDTYYPIGWKGFIDEKPVEIHRINYGFMGIVVPKGKHEVEFLYHPESFYNGRIMTLIINFLLIGGLVFSFFIKNKNVNP
jgi:hypothetical protein